VKAYCLLSNWHIWHKLLYLTNITTLSCFDSSLPLTQHSSYTKSIRKQLEHSSHHQLIWKVFTVSSVHVQHASIRPYHWSAAAHCSTNDYICNVGILHITDRETLWTICFFFAMFVNLAAHLLYNNTIPYK